MISTKVYRLLLVLFIISLAFNACSKDDDDMMLDKQQSNNEKGDPGDITLYRVKGGNIEKVKDYKVTGKDLEYQKDVAKHQAMWNLVKKIASPKYVDLIGEFVIFNGEKAELGGYATPKKDDLTTFVMGLAINLIEKDVKDIEYVAIHEFGHILTLNNTQLDPNILENACSNFYPREGCAKKESYINKLYQGYWADIWSEFIEGNDQFYKKYKDRFVSEYASTDPGEDIAEVFTSFVYENKPSGSTKAQEKILLMYKSKELIELRNYIRKNQFGLKSGRSSFKGRNSVNHKTFKNLSCGSKH